MIEIFSQDTLDHIEERGYVQGGMAAYESCLGVEAEKLTTGRNYQRIWPGDNSRKGEGIKVEEFKLSFLPAEYEIYEKMPNYSVMENILFELFIKENPEKNGKYRMPFDIIKKKTETENRLTGNNYGNLGFGSARNPQRCAYVIDGERVFSPIFTFANGRVDMYGKGDDPCMTKMEYYNKLCELIEGAKNGGGAVDEMIFNAVKDAFIQKVKI